MIHMGPLKLPCPKLKFWFVLPPMLLILQNGTHNQPNRNQWIIHEVFSISASIYNRTLYYEFHLFNISQMLPLPFITFILPKSEPHSSLASTNAFSSHDSLLCTLITSGPSSGAGHSIWCRTSYEWWMVKCEWCLPELHTPWLWS